MTDSRKWLRLILALAFFQTWISAPLFAASAAPPVLAPPLTNTTQIHELTPEQSALNPQVQLTGFVTLCLSTNIAFIQDDGGGILLNCNQLETPLLPGMTVTATGQVRPGQYAPVVFRAHVKPADEALPAPPAPLLSFDQMLDDYFHARLIETIGVIRCTPPSLTPGTYFEVVAGQSRILVIMTDVKGLPVPPELYGAKVRLRGVCAALFNEKNQIRGAKIYVSGFTNITILQPAIPLSRLKLQPIGNLKSLKPRSLYPPRELFRGVVTHAIASPVPLLYVADHSGATTVQLQENQPPLSVGDRVEVTAYPGTESDGFLWADGTVRGLTEGAPPAAENIQPESLLDSEINARLVHVRGRFLTSVVQPGGWTLFAQAERLVLAARLPAGLEPAALQSLQPGTILDLTGIAESERRDFRQARSPQLLLRSLDDVREVARPSWWNHARVATAAMIIGALLLCGMAWAISLRLQIRHQVDTLRDQLRRETALEQQYRDLYENTGDLIYLEDHSGKVLSVNPAIEKLVGYPEAELQRMAPGEWQHSASTTDYQAWMEGQRKTSAGGSFEFEIKSRTGARLVLDVHARTASPDAGDGRMLCLARDITDRKLAEENLLRAKAELEAANRDLAARNGELHQTNLSLQEEILERQRAEAGIAQALQQIWEASRQAGKAEMATHVLHNVGNVLNSVGVSASMLARQVSQSQSGTLAKVAEMLAGHEGDLGAFLTSHEKGSQLPRYLAQLASCLQEELTELSREAATLTRNLLLVRNVIALQQNYARVAENVEAVPLRDVVEDALFIHTASPDWANIEIDRDYQNQPSISINRQRLLHLLFNLLQNAQHACEDSITPRKRVSLRLYSRGIESAVLTISDNGIGIPPGNLNKLFDYGFTTRQNSQGFGLHNAAQFVRQIGGSLTASSEGVGRGATFTLELPVKSPTDLRPHEDHSAA